MNFKEVIYKIMHWESWPYLVKYIPIIPVWFFYAFRSRSLWWFTPSNPTLTFGGFEGERKIEMYNQLPPRSYPPSLFIEINTPFPLVLQKMAESCISFPCAVKPDAGMMGLMFRKITDLAQLQLYHHAMKVDYIIQDFIDYPLEVSVFYYRIPGLAKGVITGFLKKESMHVTGNGINTLNELITNYKRARFRLNEIRSKFNSKLNIIIPLREKVILSQALNLSRGGKLISLEMEKDDKLLAVFDGISNYTQSFYYGRYDIKCKSVKDLKEGRNFYILEYNGSGAEPHHIYGNNYTLLQAYKIVISHWKVLYKISRKNYSNGIKYWPFKKGWQYLRLAKMHFKHLKILDASFENIQ